MAVITSKAQAQKLNQVVLTQNINTEGVFAIKVYIQGNQKTIVVDDYLPFKDGYLIYASENITDFSIWVPLFKKALAKVYGSYELLTQVQPESLILLLTGHDPITYNNIELQSQIDFETIIETALVNNEIIVFKTTGDIGLTNLGLRAGHYYPILEVYQLQDLSGGYQGKLYRLRDSYGDDGYYNATWSDEDYTSWSTIDTSLFPDVDNTSDGFFFISPSDLKSQISKLIISDTSSFIQSYQVNDDDSQWKSFSFTLTQIQNIQVGVRFYDQGLYPLNCKTTNGQGLLKMYSGDQYLEHFSTNDSNGYEYKEYPTMQPGEYTIWYKHQWNINEDYKDYSIIIYSSAETFTINLISFSDQSTADTTLKNLDFQNALDLAFNNQSGFAYKRRALMWYKSSAFSQNTFYYEIGDPYSKYSIDYIFTFKDYNSSIISYSRDNSITTCSSQIIDASTGQQEHECKCNIRPSLNQQSCVYFINCEFQSNASVTFTFKYTQI